MSSCLHKTVEWTSPDGGMVGRVVRGLTRVGIYVPGGTAAYPVLRADECRPRQGGRSGGDRHGHASHGKPQ